MEGLGRQHKYFIEVQARSESISLMKQVLLGGGDEEQINLRRRTDSFFQEMFASKESFVVHSDLLFKIRFPKRGDQFSCLLVLERSDAERKLASLHVKHLHRGYIFLYAIFSRRFYAKGMVKLAFETVRVCPLCQAHRSRPRLKVDRLNVNLSRMNWSLDHKGFMYLDQKRTKYYVLCAVETNLRLVNFSLTRSITGKETAKLIFQKIICAYGSCMEFSCDRSKSFMNEFVEEMLALSGILMKLSNSYRPSANFSEERSVRKL